MRKPEELIIDRALLYKEATENIIALMEENNLTEIKFDNEEDFVWALANGIHGIEDVQVHSILLWKDKRDNKYLSIYDNENMEIYDSFNWEIDVYNAIYNRLNNKKDE